VGKPLGALGLGFLGFFLLMSFGEMAGPIPGFILVAAYFAVCQFLLSRGHADAYRKDWWIMIALDATVLAAVFVMVLVEKRDVILSQGPAILLSCCGGTYAGAVAASLGARRRPG
jgi:hypothetical protein